MRMRMRMGLFASPESLLGQCPQGIRDGSKKPPNTRANAHSLISTWTLIAPANSGGLSMGLGLKRRFSLFYCTTIYLLPVHIFICFSATITKMIERECRLFMTAEIPGRRQRFACRRFAWGLLSAGCHKACVDDLAWMFRPSHECFLFQP